MPINAPANETLKTLGALDNNKAHKCNNLQSLFEPKALFSSEIFKGSLREVVPVKNEMLAKRFVKQIAEGLEYLHQKKIIHLDIKCANVLRDDKGNLKIGDLGVSKIAVNTVGHYKHMESPNAGTVLYMAPEVLDDGMIGRRSDIW